MPSPVVAFRRSRAFAFVARVTRPVRNRFDISYVYHFDLRGPTPDLRADVPVEMCRATPAEVEEAGLLVSPETGAKFLARLDGGMACFVAKIGGRVVAYNWTRYRSGEDEGDVIELGPGEIYTTDAYTAERFRGRKIHTETLGYMLQAAKADGYLDAYTMGSALKLGSRKSMPRLGWRLAGRVLRVRTGERYLFVRITGSARPFIPAFSPREAAA